MTWSLIVRAPSRSVRARGLGGEPAAFEAGAPESDSQLPAAAHRRPDQAGAMVLDHEHGRALVDAEMVRRDPADPTDVASEERIERRLEAVRIRNLDVQP